MSENQKTVRIGKTDGRLFPVEEDDVFPGAALRMVNRDGSAAPFSDFLVLKVFPVDKSGQRVHEAEREVVRAVGVQVTISRPYALVSGAGTSCPSVLTGVETLTVDMATLTSEGSQFRVMATARGRVCEHGR